MRKWRQLEWDKIDLKRSLMFITALVMLAIVVQVFLFIVERDRGYDKARALVREEGSRVAMALDLKFADLMHEVKRFSERLSAGKIRKYNLVRELKKSIGANPEAFGFGAAYDEYKYSPDLRLYSPYFVHSQGEIEIRTIAYDYTLREDHCKWFYLPIETNGGSWKEPHYGRASRAWLVGYGAPFYRRRDKQKKNPIGTIFTSYSLDGLKELMESMELGKTGYGYLVSQKGTFLSHPISDYVKQEKNVFQLGEDLNDKKLKSFGKKIREGQTGIMEIENEVSGQKSLMYYQPIPSTGWMLVVMFAIDDIHTDIDGLRVRLMVMLIFAVIFFTLLFVIAFKVYEGATTSLWKLSTSFSLLLCLGIAAIWAISVHYPGEKNSGGTIILDKTGLLEFKKNYPEENAVYVPTGVFIQSLEFTSANNVSLTGYIWQKYPRDTYLRWKEDPEKAPISCGFVLPEAIEATITQDFKREDGEQVTLGWYFESNLRQSFDYSRFPLDEKDVWIRLWHKDFDKNVILTPDLESYKLRNPGSRPGIEEDIVLSGLEIRSSYFSYLPKSYNTNFGINKYVGEDNFPELYYTVVVRRNFIDPFISYLLPFLVIAGIIFSLFLIITDDPVMAEKFDYNCAFILAAATGLIFAVLVAHSQLRSSLGIHELIYLEYFYIVLYVMILLLIIDSFFFSMEYRVGILHYRNNLLPKLMYWPTVFGVLFIITFFIFL